jgi:outer membrane protein assembly factor BamB
MARFCSLLGITLSLSVGVAARADDWPRWLGPQGDSVWRETNIVDHLPKTGPPIKWRAPVAYGYSGPAVAAGRVYVTDYQTTDPLVNKASARTKLEGQERILCFDADNGKVLWRHQYKCPYEISYPGGPRATPTVHDGKVYALGAEGNLTCLDAVSGSVVWARDLHKDYNVKTPYWGYSGSPLVDGQKVICIVGGKDNAVVAFDKDSGNELWKALSCSEAGYSSPVIIQAAGRRQLIVWHPEAINCLDPETGKLYWTSEAKLANKMSIMTPRHGSDYLYVGGIGTIGVCLMLDPDKPAVTEAYRGEKNRGIFPVNSTPVVDGELMYGVSQQGELMAVTLATGEQLWETLKATTRDDRKTNNATAFLVRNGDRYFLFNESGHLIIARLNRKGYEENSRFKLLEPTNTSFNRPVVWTHPAFARRCIFARNDKELVCASLAAEEK